MPGAAITRFDSWKEIAVYLGRDIRTVRRWEHERALPVHRIPGGGRRAVYAFRDEIDSWLSITAEHTPASDGASNPKDGTNGIPRDIQPGAGERKTSTQPARAGDSAASLSSQNNSYTLKVKETQQTFLKVFAAAALVFVAILGMFLLRTPRIEQAFSAADGDHPPEITAVSPIMPRPDQTVVIRGSGFGLYTQYRNGNTPFIAIRDMTARWAAGRTIPQNSDDVTLDVKSWDDKAIIISGFSGAYGSGEWKLNVGDEIEVAVWNPQSGRGPATYHLVVTAPSGI